MTEVAGAITKEALVMAGFQVNASLNTGTLNSCSKDDMIFLFTDGGLNCLCWGGGTKEFDPPITTMPRLMDEIEAFEESIKSKEQDTEDIPLSAEQFMADGWERTAGYNFYKQGMYACFVDNDRTWRLLVGNDDTIHTTMRSLKARIRGLIDQKFQWLISGV